MNNYILQKITETSLEVVNIEGEISVISASRTRDTDGYCEIVIQMGSNTIGFNTDDFGGNYEVAAREFAKILEVASTHPCLLPVIK